MERTNEQNKAKQNKMAVMAMVNEVGGGLGRKSLVILKNVKDDGHKHEIL